MKLLNLRNVLIPLLSFSLIVGGGFATFTFITDTNQEVKGNVIVGTNQNELGFITITEDDNYKANHRIVYEIGDDVADNSKGIYLSKPILYQFSDFIYPEQGYGYYLSYSVNYTVDFSSDTSGGFYYHYTVIDDLKEEKLPDTSNVTSAQLGTQVSNGILLDESLFTYTDTSNCTYSGSLDICFIYRDGTKPVNADEFHDLIGMLETTYANETVEIILSIQYKQIEGGQI